MNFDIAALGCIPGQMEGALPRNQTLHLKRKSRSVRAPTGQTSTTLPE